MEFKHPEILYFLFLLIIPFLVNLFQLRRFHKEYFTNVRFLKELSIQTRKSSKLKKWLLLFVRLLLLTCIILAFSQPFFKAKDSDNISNEMFIILDNSFSMQAKGKKGELLKRAVQNLLENVPENQIFSLITNTDTYWNIDIKSIQKELQQLRYSFSSFELDYLISKIKARKTDHNKDIIIITDAIGLDKNQIKNIDTTFNTYFIIPKAENKNNVSIDSVFISQTLENFYEIKAKLTSYGENKTAIPIALYNNNKLAAKTLVNLESKNQEISFTIPREDFNGFISITDNSLEYDNNYFFSISKPEKINILSIGNTEKKDFLSKIYTLEDFNFNTFSLATLDYNILDKQDVIIVNEIKEIPESLQKTLKAFIEKGGTIVLIPSIENTIDNLNSFSKHFGTLEFKRLENKEKLITKIAFDNQLYQSVFEKKIDNFQYPNTKSSFIIKSTSPSVLTYDDQSAFLIALQNPSSVTYIFAAPINKTNSNFQNSPLIVPTFYNMGQNSEKTGLNAMIIGNNKPLFIDEIVSKDEIVTIKNEKEQFILIQQILNNKVKLNFDDYPQEAGNFGIFKNETRIRNCSFNYNRTESNLIDYNDQLLSDYRTTIPIESIFDTLHTNRTDNQIWRWFILLTLFFLVTEIIIQKFIK